MISLSTNLSVVLKAKLEEIRELKNNPDPVLRTVALAVLPAMKHRVHVEGKDSGNGNIGTYSPGYMKVRTGNYTDAAKNREGKFKNKKSQAKGEAGVFTDRTIRLNKKTGVFTGDNKAGTARPVYNRTTDSKVILSLTRQMENDMSVVPSGNGYGIGYLNPDNFKKAGYCEATYGKKILTKLTKEEKDLAIKTAQGFIAAYLKSDRQVTPESYLGI
jgi:hypothetical protein